MNLSFYFLAGLIFFSCSTKQDGHTGSIERVDTALNSIIDKNARIEIIARGFEWAEGPLWIEQEKMLLFSDIPANTIYKWTEENGKQKYLSPSGYTGAEKRGGETGSNGLLLSKAGRLVLCQHGNRQLAWMNANLDDPQPNFETIADNYRGKKFNSPNDAVFNKKGELFFTDPPYGLEKNMDDTSKQIPFQGVYKVTASGHVVLLIDSITRPNGIAIAADEKKLFIANSDPQKPYWYVFDVGASDSLTNGRIFYDATAASKLAAGMPDGMKTDKQGNIFATGPGGVWIFNKEAKLLGKIKFPELVSNCALTADEKTLYVTADSYVLRIKMR